MNLGSFAGLVLMVATIVAPAPAVAALPDDPTNRVEGNNPSIAQKVLGYDAWTRANRRQPDVLILGSSRSVMLDPQQVRRVAGRTAYNAGISSGAARELLALSTFADLRSGGRPPHLVVMLDLEAFDNRRPITRVLDYQRRMDRTKAGCGELDGCRRTWLLAAQALVADAVARQRTAARSYHETQRADGRQINGMLERLEQQGRDLDALRRERIETRLRSYRVGGFDKIYPVPALAFEQLLELANERGDVPFVAITTMHPECIERCGPAGWTARRREVKALLAELGERHEFEIVDLSYPGTWGGSGADFFDEIHLRPLGAAKVVRRLDALGAFEVRSAR